MQVKPISLSFYSKNSTKKGYAVSVISLLLQALNLDILVVLENNDVLALQTLFCRFTLLGSECLYLRSGNCTTYIAAQQSCVDIDTDKFTTQLSNLSTQTDCVIVEGAGGWQLLLQDNTYLSDWVVKKALPVILIVGGKLVASTMLYLLSLKFSRMVVNASAGSGIRLIQIWNI